MRKWNRLTGIFMSILLTAVSITVTVPLTAVQAAYEERSGYVTGNSVNVRTGAGTSNAKITQLDMGHEVLIKEETKASNGAVWYRIHFTKDGVEMEDSDTK